MNTLRGNGFNIEQQGSKIVIEAVTPEAQNYLHTNKTGSIRTAAENSGVRVSGMDHRSVTIASNAPNKTWAEMNTLATNVMGHVLSQEGEFGQNVSDGIENSAREAGIAHQGFKVAAPVPQAFTPPTLNIPGVTKSIPTVRHNTLGG